MLQADVRSGFGLGSCCCRNPVHRMRTRPLGGSAGEGETMLYVVALFFGPLLLLVGIICRDALSGPVGHEGGGIGASEANPAHYVILTAIAICFVSLLALVGRT